MKKISETYIFEATKAVSEYAYNRFMWKYKKASIEPKRPQKYNWP